MEAPNTVSYDANGGTGEMAPQTFYSYGDNAQLTTAILNKNAFTRSGYVFGGWNTMPDGTGTAYADGADYSENIVARKSGSTLYAQWKAAVYDITYKDAGNKPFSGTHGSGHPTKHTYGTETPLVSPTRTGYTFGGWYTNKECTGDSVTSLAADAYTAAITLYAKWTAKTYTVSFNANGGTSSTLRKTVSYGSTYGALPTPTRTGYGFAGWYTATSGGTKIESTTTVSLTGNQTLYAHWKANTYTITYNGLDDATLTTKPTMHTYGTATTVGAPTKTGYTFAGWKVNSGSTVTKNLTLGAADYTANITLTATWTANQYTVTFDYQGATGGTTTTTQEVTYDSDYGSLPSPTRTGYTFGGWYTAASGGTKVTSITKVTKTVNHTLYARWTPNKYTVTFDYQGATGGTSTPTQEVTYDSTYGNLPAPTRKGYGFVGWFTKASGGTQVKSATKVQTAGGHKLYARWNLISYNINYNLDGGTVTGNPTAYTIESKDFTLKNPTKPGYTFAGWSNISMRPSMNVTIQKGTTGNLNYNANWTANTYHVTLNGNGGSGGTSLASYTYGTGASLPADWTKTGYTFSGWYDNEELTGTAVTEISGTDIGDKEYWAKWTDDIAPVIGTPEYSYQPKNLWQWLIGRESLTITVPVTEEGSGADTITYTVTPEGGTADTKTSDISDGKATITVPADFKGTILITCTDKAGNSSANVTVGADLRATGIIIEQNAPEISARADRGPTDTEQTGDVALSEGYYESAPAITVTVKDDTDNAVTAGIASVACHIGEREYPVNVSTASLQPEVTFTVPAAEIPTGVTTIRIEATDNAGNTASETITLKVKGPEKKPAAKINYQTEKLTGLVADADYTINGTAYQSDADGCIAIDGSWLGTEITIVRKGNGSETRDSEGQKLDIPLRPAAPAAPVLDSRTDGSVTLEPITDAQYRIADGSWQTGTAFTGLEEKTVYSFNAYYPATDTAFASLPGDSTEIATMPTPPTEDKLAVSYVGETFALNGGVEAFTEQDCNNEAGAGNVTAYMGQTLYIRYPADGIIPASLTTAVQIPARPEEPNAEGHDASYPNARDGSITGLDASFTYELRVKGTDGSFGAWEKAELSGTEIPNLPAGEYEVRVMAVENVCFRSGGVAVTIGEKPATRQDTPAIQIDYTKEVLTGFVPDAQYCVTYTDRNGTEQTRDIRISAGEAVPVEDDWFGTTFSIVRKGNGKDKTDSDPQSLPVPARPAKPAPTGADETGPDKEDGKLTGLTADTAYEISADGGQTWESRTADGNGEITGLAPGSYVVRVKAGVSNFASEPSGTATIVAYRVKVTFMANGEIYQTVSVDYGKDLTEIPPVPAKKDAGDRIYIGRWCSDEQGTAAVFTGLTADMTVYAVYTEVYTVTLNGNGGSGGASLTSYTYGEGAALPTDWTKTGYTLEGWYDNAGCTGTAVREILATDTGDKEYWAKWTPISYTITYILDGGTVTGNPENYTIESDAITLNNPAKAGCTFAGWSGTGLTGNDNMSVTIAKGNMGNREYTAHWTENTYTVTLADGKGYTLSAVSGSTSPVKEGGSFSFQFALNKGYQKTGKFAIKVNDVKVELTKEKTYTITDIRENKNVTVEGVKKKTSSDDSDDDTEEDSNPSTGNNPSTGGNPSTGDNPPTGSNPRTNGNPSTGNNSPTGNNLPSGTDGKEDTRPEERKEPDSSQPSEQNPERPSEAEKERRPGKEGQTIPASTDNGRLIVSGETVETGNITETSETATQLTVGNGEVIVTVVCEEQTCTAGVKDTVAVANAVLSPEQIQLVNDGENIEIRVDVKDISKTVPGQDKEVIESGLTECRREAPDMTLGMYVDISMFIKVGEGDWDAVTSTEEPIDVVIGIPEELKGDGRKFYIIRSHDGEYTLLTDTDDDPDTITVSTNLFSAYAIAYEQAEGSARCGLCHICPTFLGICCFIWLAVILAILLIIWIVIGRKRKEEYGFMR